MDVRRPGIQVESAETTARYFEAIMDGKRREATGLALDAMAAGMSAAAVLSDVVGQAMELVGHAWQNAQAGVAQEHRATSISEYVVQAIGHELASVPRKLRAEAMGAVICTCAEGEWHLLPLNMAAVALTSEGWDVTVLGPSAPPDDLAQLAAQSGPSVVAVTCMMPSSMPGAWRTISALRRAGLRVLACGRAFAGHPEWAAAIGADAVAGSYPAAIEYLSAVAHLPPAPSRAPVGARDAVREVVQLERDGGGVVEAALGGALQRWPGLSSRDAAVKATRADLEATLRAIAAAVLVREEALLHEFVVWFEDVLAARGLPLAFVPAAFDLLARSIPPAMEQSVAVAERGMEFCQESPPGSF